MTAEEKEYQEFLANQKAQNGGSYPKLDITTRFRIIENDNEQIVFSFPEKVQTEDGGEKWENKEYPNAITGVFIGDYKIYQSFSKNHGSMNAAGSFFTTPFFSKSDKVRIFSTRKVRINAPKEMSAEVAAQIMGQQVGHPAGSMVMCLLFATKKGIVEFRSPIVVGIEQMKKMKSYLETNVMSISPAIWTKKLHKEKGWGFDNPQLPPKFPLIEPTQVHIKEKLSEFGVLTKQKQFIEFKKQIQAGNAAGEEDVLANESVPSTSPKFTQESGFSMNDIPDDDLPF